MHQNVWAIYVYDNMPNIEQPHPYGHHYEDRNEAEKIVNYLLSDECNDRKISKVILVCYKKDHFFVREKGVHTCL